MPLQPTRKRLLIAYVALYFIFAAAAARGILELGRDPGFGIMLGLLAFYLLLLLVEPKLISRSILYLHIINGLQTAIALVLLVWVGSLDYFALLFIPPCTQSILNFPRKTALVWIIAITLLMEAALLVSFPVAESVGYAIIYPTANFLFTALSYLAKESGEARDRSEMLLADLQVANRKLQDYAAQVEELAAVKERNRLARELHDSVTQIIFGLTLSAQAARILIDRSPARAVVELDHLQALAQNALAEMRSLIQEMRPAAGSEVGLVPALQRLAVEHKANDGLLVELQVRGACRLPEKVETELLRVVREALINIVKHARVEKAVITLNLENEKKVFLGIEDAGVGFDPARVKSLPGHLGLVSMQERVQALGGTLAIESQPGKGTRLSVEISLEQEVEHA